MNPDSVGIFYFKIIRMQKLQKGDSKLLNAWAFYDWANSVYALVISSTIFPLYYGALFAVRMFSKNLKEDEYITYLSVPEIEFMVNTYDWHLDGEYNEIASPIQIKVLPKSLKILI